MTCKLSDLSKGEIARIIRLNIKNRKIKRHLLDMGLTRNVEITVKKIAPMGEPIDIELRDYELCLSKEEATQIEVERIDKL